MPDRSVICLLRGVNVNGVTVRSAPLAEVFRGLGLDGVRTVLASGNVVFETSAPLAELKGAIEAALSDAFGYEAWVVLVERSELERIVEAFPFEEAAGRQPYVVFGSDAAALRDLAAFAAARDGLEERVAEGDGVLYWDAEKGASTTSAFAKEAARGRYRAVTTTRNLRTLRKLL